MNVCSALVLFALASAVHAQTLPDAPKPHFDRIEWSLLATDAATRSLDVYSTHWSLSVGNREATLPGWIANHSPAMAIYSGSIVASQYYVARELFAHHHRKWAYFVTTADVAVVAPFAIRNLFMPVCIGPNTATASGCQTQPTAPPAPIPIPIPDRL